jgi:hypothetical protein
LLPKLSDASSTDPDRIIASPKALPFTVQVATRRR